jgi:hypothetical protein
MILRKYQNLRQWQNIVHTQLLQNEQNNTEILGRIPLIAGCTRYNIMR